MPNLTALRDKALATGLNTVAPIYSKVAGGIDQLTQTAVGRTVVSTAGKGIGLVSPVVDRLFRGKDEPLQSNGNGKSEDIPTITGSAPLVETPSGSPVVGIEMPTVEALALPGYDTLSPEEVVARLEGLIQSDLAAIYAYEKATQGRSDILAAIDGRLVDLPLPTYDSLEIPAILSAIESLTPEELAVLRDYEASTRNRFPVVGKIDSLLASGPLN